jgi:hypothetical protein
MDKEITLKIELTPRSPMSVALRKRHGSGRRVFRDRRLRRAKDARKHWSRDQED